MFYLFRSRKRVMRIFLGSILGIVCITMVITLIPGIYGNAGTSTNDTVLAQVGKEEITQAEAQAQLQDTIRSQRLPSQAYNFLAPQVVRNMIDDAVLLQEAERLGLNVTEEELANVLRASWPQLFPDGKFVGKEQYAQYVYQLFEKSVPEFEALARKDLALSKLRRLVTDGVVVTPAEVEQEFKRRNEKVKIDYALVTPASVMSSVSSTPAEIEEYFKKNRNMYMVPEKRSFQYVLIDDAAVASRVKVTPEELQRYYNENKERFRVQDRVHVTHILFKTTDKKPEEVKQIEAKAQDVLKQVRAGKDFAALAKENSEDTASAAKGGDIGWITRGQTVPEFEQKAFSMKPGEVSDLVKTQYGFHIIKVLEKETARLKPFQEVEPTIREEFMRDRSDAEKSALMDRLRTAATRHGQNLQEAAREVGLSVNTATMLDRNSAIPQLGNETGVMESLFSAAKGSLVGPIQMTGNKAIMAVITEVAPARQAEFSEVADRVKNDCNTAKARDLVKARADKLAERAKAFGDLRKAAREFGVEVKSSDLFTRDGSIPGLGGASTVSDAFNVPPHSVVGPVRAGADFAVYQVTERVGADMSLFASESKVLHDTMTGTRQNEAFDIFKDELRKRMEKEGKVKVYQSRVDRFVASNQRNS
jgi:peptidyl-prolyl cis-trans isomerase D